ncbi:hypothetical protein K443DRAFT_7707 [Laccaria amethystina LaAM-08-1]|uniref:Uncharacterized protein n=1 Tax=Laccaria amethystina LaAM-08-1 TaxID=1095629 RepID=A0A0C9XRV2_9AGAR|nr:hypothetical protein K443DRAFT_7707 [Laccaria amethystina LaAM-08-1]
MIAKLQAPSEPSKLQAEPPFNNLQHCPYILSSRLPLALGAAASPVTVTQAPVTSPLMKQLSFPNSYELLAHNRAREQELEKRTFLRSTSGGSATALACRARMTPLAMLLLAITDKVCVSILLCSLIFDNLRRLVHSLLVIQEIGIMAVVLGGEVVVVLGTSSSLPFLLVRLLEDHLNGHAIRSDDEDDSGRGSDEPGQSS